MLTVVALALPLLPGAYAHGYLVQPKPRNPPNRDVAMQKNFATDGIFGGPVFEPGSQQVPEPVCAIGGQFMELNNPGPIVQTYAPGQWIDVKWKVVVAHGGHYSYRLCPDGSDTEACFQRNALKFKDGTTWKASHGTFGALEADSVQIPENMQCDRCTLSWRWDSMTANQGIPDAGKVRINCVDVQIKSASSASSASSSSSAYGNANPSATIGTAKPSATVQGGMISRANLSANSFLTLLLLAAPAVVSHRWLLEVRS